MITIEKKRKRSDRGAAHKVARSPFRQLCVQEYPLDLLFLSQAVRSSDSFVRTVRIFQALYIQGAFSISGERYENNRISIV